MSNFGNQNGVIGPILASAMIMLTLVSFIPAFAFNISVLDKLARRKVAAALAEKGLEYFLNQPWNSEYLNNGDHPTVFDPDSPAINSLSWTVTPIGINGRLKKIRLFAESVRV